MSKAVEETLRLLAENGRLSAGELAATRGVHPNVQLRLLNRLHERKQVRIAGWQRPDEGTSGCCSALWAAGPGRDAPRIPRLTRSEINKRYRDRHRALLSVRNYGEKSTYATVWGQLLKASNENRTN